MAGPISPRRWRARSLWVRAVAVTVVVACTPQLFLLLSGVADGQVGQRMRRELAHTVTQVGEALAQDPESSALAAKAEAQRSAAWVRVLDEQGLLLADENRDGDHSLLNRLGQLFFGPDGAPSLAEHDQTLPPLAQREDLQRAAPLPTTRCETSQDNKLLVCSASLRVSTPEGERLLYAQQSSRRAIRALYDLRYQMLKLTLFSGLAAAGLGLWLAGRIVYPLHQLRQEVQRRVAARVSTTPIPMRRDDEIGDVAASFNELLAALEARNRSYERFVEDLVHEMKNPVAAVRAAAEMLGDTEPDEARSRRLGRVLQTSSQRLDTLVTQFLELARAEGGLRADDRAPLDLRGLSRALCEQLALAHPSLRVHTELPESPAMVMAAGPYVESALRNLLDNAAHFAGPEGELRLSLIPQDKGYTLTVSDSGPGIPPEHLPRVFDRFFTTRAKGQGTGLGLAMSRAVFEAHGGRLNASSPAGSGAQLSAWLPAAPQRADDVHATRG